MYGEFVYLVEAVPEFWYIFLELFCYSNRKGISVLFLTTGTTGHPAGSTGAPLCGDSARHCRHGRTPSPAPPHAAVPLGLSGAQ